MGFGVEKGVAVKPTPEHELPRGESTSQSEGRFWDEFSASHSFGNCIPF